jgi:hypothetical protein
MMQAETDFPTPLGLSLSKPGFEELGTLQSALRQAQGWRC